MPPWGILRWGRWPSQLGSTARGSQLLNRGQGRQTCWRKLKASFPEMLKLVDFPRKTWLSGNFEAATRDRVENSKCCGGFWVTAALSFTMKTFGGLARFIHSYESVFKHSVLTRGIMISEYFKWIYHRKYFLLYKCSELIQKRSNEIF